MVDENLDGMNDDLEVELSVLVQLSVWLRGGWRKKTASSIADFAVVARFYALPLALPARLLALSFALTYLSHRQILHSP